jgi:hypothetical protein
MLSRLVGDSEGFRLRIIRILGPMRLEKDFQEKERMLTRSLLRKATEW